MASKVSTVGCVGTGVIGASWTALFLAYGLKVIVSDPGPGAEEKLAAHLKEFWPTLEKLGLKSGASLSNYEFVGASMQGRYAECDFIQENAPERLDLKNKLIGEIDAEARPGVVIASSSSGIPSSQFIRECSKESSRVLIGHPFNPPHLMPLVEVVPHSGSSINSVQSALAFYRAIGKKPVHIKKEIPGHVANRLQAAICAESYSLVAHDVLSAEDLDTCMTTSLGPRWAVNGPFMSNALGGGGGTEGFNHMIDHLGPAMKVWLDDMNQKSFDWSTESCQTLKTSVAAELKGLDTELVAEERDAVLIELFQAKSKASTIV